MLFEGFIQYIKTNRLVCPGDTIILAVSGGPDSFCLLHLFNRLAVWFNLKLVVAHLNHQLRPEADEEEAGVADLASKLGLDFESEAVDIRSYKKAERLSEEAAGRKARYRFFAEIARKHSAKAVALGHHRDDQAETVLLNILRGCSVDGLAGMRPLSSYRGIRLIRPLLPFRRSEIEAYCLEKELHFFTDSSNLEQNYRRNRLRLDLMPHLAENYNPQIVEALAGLGELAAADRRFLGMLACRAAKTMVRRGNSRVTIDLDAFSGLAEALRGRVLLLAVNCLNPGKEISRRHVKQLLKLADCHKSGQFLSLPGGIKAYRHRGRLIMVEKNDPKNDDFVVTKLKVPGKTLLPGRRELVAWIRAKDDLTWPPPRYRAYLDYDNLPTGTLLVRKRIPGDRFFPQGAAGSKKLKDFLIDHKIDRRARDWLPLVTVGDEIVWVAGLRIAHPYRVTERTNQVLVLELRSLLTRSRRQMAK
jgi:tRNA(Ile)-lysidine synthase